MAGREAYYQGCGLDDPSHNHYSGGEPLQPDITASPTAASKWADLINTSTLPTSQNPDCSQCPPDINPPPSNLIVGTYEGAGYYHCGLYRPSYNCKMRMLGQPFCAVCRRVIDEYLTPFDPNFCAARDKFDLSKWAAVATILFGVIQDGGGVILVNGRPIPIDPWGPLRESLWGNMAHPHEANPAVRDVVVGLALSHISSLVSSSAYRERIGAVAQQLVTEAAGKLPARTIA